MDQPEQTETIDTPVVVEQTVQEKKKEQLAKARATKANKKRQRDEDLCEMKCMLNSLITEKKKKANSEEEEEEKIPPVKKLKKTVVTKQEDEEDEDIVEDENTLRNQLIKTSVLAGLGMASWYVQNRFGSTAKNTPVISSEKKKKKIFQSRLLHKRRCCCRVSLSVSFNLVWENLDFQCKLFFFF
jgi:hypothetical protein